MKFRVILLTLMAVVLGSSIGLTASGLWTTVAPMPIAVYEAASAAINGQVYVVGGLDAAGSFRAELQVYDPASNSWAMKAPAPTIIYSPGFAAIGDKLYVAGGAATGGGLSNRLVVYDSIANSWTTKASMPIAQANASSAAVDGKLYVVGGIEDTGIANNPRTDLLQVYDPVTDTWAIKTPMPTARAAGAAVGLEGKLFVVGGEPTNTSFTNAVEMYDPATDTWTIRAPMPSVRGVLGAAVVNGLLFAIGGETAGTVLANNEVYNPGTDTWTFDTSMPTARIGFHTVSVNGVMYAIGGATDYPFNVISVAEAFSPAPSTSYSAIIQPPINADGTSVFNAKRGVVPVKLKLLTDGTATCDMPPATIALFRVAGSTSAPVNESEYVQPSDSGNNFRVDVAGCQYVYNLGASSLGAGTYRIEITLDPAIGTVGSGTFALK